MFNAAHDSLAPDRRELHRPLCAKRFTVRQTDDYAQFAHRDPLSADALWPPGDPIEARFIRITARRDQLPDDHPGAGNAA